MHLAYVLSFLSVVLSSVTALATFAISRAPGWKSARAFSLIALTAALYSAGNPIFETPDLPFLFYAAAARWNYLWAALHVLLWLPWTFGGPEASWRAVPRPLRLLAAMMLGVTLFFAATGLHVRSTSYMIVVPWAGVTYHNLLTTPAGDAYGAALILMLLLPLVAVVRRARREPGQGWVVAGFGVFFAAAVVEVLVANQVIVFLSPADVGFLAVVVPTALQLQRRFVDDARRLHELSGRLAGEVRERTEERDVAESALLEAERHAALGRLAAGVGHEISNPLTYVQLSLEEVAEHLAASGAPEGVRHSLADAREGAWRIQKVVEGLRLHSRRLEERRRVDPADVARAALQMARPHLRHVASVEQDLRSATPLEADEPRLVQALVNLLVNAAQAVADREGAGRVVLRASDDAAGVRFEVEDDGPGIPDAHRARLGEPYFTTRGANGGLGLGLFVTRGIVDTHGGTLAFEAPPGGGTLVRITLPAAVGPAEARPVPAAPAAVPFDVAPPLAGSERPRLLLVDDEPLVLDLLAQTLGRRWDVTTASSGRAALERLACERFEAMVCDLFMPGVSGMELARQLESIDPRLRARMLFLTGGAVTLEAEEFLQRPDVLCLEKPVALDELDERLRERLALEAPAAAPRASVG